METSSNVNEGTHLLLTSSSGNSSTHHANITTHANTNTNAKSTLRYQHARDILLSTTLTRLGSRAWEFATPLLLLEWTPTSLAAPAALGLACSLFRSSVSPWLGNQADKHVNRMDVVILGTGLQAFGCLVSVCALVLYNALSGGYKLPLLALVICAGVIESLGSQLSSVAVKKEWVPIVFSDDKDTTKFSDEQPGVVATDEQNSLFKLPRTTLSFINTSMTNIDLMSAMFGPVLAGWVLQVVSGEATTDGMQSTSTSMQKGFATIAICNVFSFIPEIVLLRRVYSSCPALQQKEEVQEPSNLNKNGEVSDKTNPWKLWHSHPSGLPLLSISVAALYLTALSPNGVVLTAYLVTVGLSPTSIGLFRAVGNLSGVVGISFFSLLRKRGNGRSIVGAIEHLRRISLAFLLLEVISIAIAAVSFFNLMHSSSSFEKEDEGDKQSIPWQVTLFLSSIIISRAGLYSFDVGALEMEQKIVDERYRNAVGSVEDALCSIAEMGMFILSIALPNPTQFGWQVGTSVFGVTTGAICYGGFICLYHMHAHSHHDDKDGHGHEHHHHHDHHHIHTLQQERELDNLGTHIHLHRSSRSFGCLGEYK